LSPWLLNTEFLDAIAELSKSQAENFGGGRLVVTGLLQGIDDRLSLYVFDLISKARCGCGGAVGPDCEV
jgi:hypothetical protein